MYTKPMQQSASMPTPKYRMYIQVAAEGRTHLVQDGYHYQAHGSSLRVTWLKMRQLLRHYNRHHGRASLYPWKDWRAGDMQPGAHYNAGVATGRGGVERMIVLVRLHE